MHSAKSIKKFEVSVLGDIREIKEEKRHGLADSGDFESGEAED
jgi:hypothetical protein